MKEFFRDKDLQSNPWLNFFELLIAMLVVWYILSGILELKFIVYALLTAFGITFLCLRYLVMTGLKTDKHYFVMHAPWQRFIPYFFWLVWQIILAALDVSKTIFKGRKGIQSQIIWFKADYDNPAARALLANSITLTPGTITIDIYDDGIFSVHALTDGAAEGLLDGTMQQKVAKVYGETIDYQVLTPEEGQKLEERTARLVPGQMRRKSA